jgi:hypothetical protein
MGYCTCGTQLVEGALFCHKCGRPTRELSVADEPQAEEQPVAVAVPAATAPIAAAPHVINFHNRLAVRTAMLMAMAVSMMLFMPFGGVVRMLASVFVLPAAGFGAVYLYHRKTGESLTAGSGARIGWLTGLFVFLITLVMLVFMVLALMSDEVRESVRQQVNAAGGDLNFEEFIAGIQSPRLFGALVVLFLFLTALPMVGGAVGATILKKDNPT